VRSLAGRLQRWRIERGVRPGDVPRGVSPMMAWRNALVRPL
jgi:hypothetical protein